MVSMQSVAFTGIPLLVIAAIWFLIFGICLLILCCCCCCCRRKKACGYSRIAYALSPIFLTLFTITAMYVSCLPTSINSYQCWICIWLNLSESIFKYISSVFSELEVVFCTRRRGSFKLVQQIYWNIFSSKQIPLLRIWRMYWLTLLKLNKLELIKFSYLLISRITLTFWEKQQIFLLWFLNLRQSRVQNKYNIFCILCEQITMILSSFLFSLFLG